MAERRTNLPMGERTFSWFPKLTKVLKTLPEEHFAEMALAIMEYGNHGIEPEFSNPLLHAVFEGIREDVDNSLKQRYDNKGGRPPKKTAVKTRVSEVKSSSENTEPGLSVSEEAFENKSSSENTEPIPYQSIPNHTNPNQSSVGVAHAPEPPTLDEVRDYFAANCLKGDPELFYAHHVESGWKTARGTPIEDWHGSALKWHRNEPEFERSRRSRAEADRLRVERAKPPDERAPVEPARPLGTAEASDRLAERIGTDYEVVGNTLVRRRAKSDAKRQIE